MAITTGDVVPSAPNYNDTMSTTSYTVNKYSELDVLAIDATSFSASDTAPLLAYWNSSANDGAGGMAKCTATARPTHIFIPGSIAGGSATFLPLGARPYELPFTGGGITVGATLYTTADGKVTTSGAVGSYAIGFARESVASGMVLFQPWVISAPKAE